MIEPWLAIGITLGVVGGGLYLSPMLLKRVQIERLRRLCRRTRSLVLTFDDGPGPELTAGVLDQLRRANARATFFLLGMRAERAPEQVEAIVAAGHEIGCHSHAHRNALRTWPWRSLSDAAAGYRTLARWLPGDALFRPPCGKLTLPTWLALWKRGAPLAWWTIDSGDTHRVLPSPAAVVARVRRDGGGVVLLHDFDRDPPTKEARAAHVLEVTRQLLTLAAAEGLSVRCLGDLLHHSHDSRTD